MRIFFERIICPICGTAPYVVIETPGKQPGEEAQQEVYCIRCRRNLAVFVETALSPSETEARQAKHRGDVTGWQSVQSLQDRNEKE